MERFVRLIPLPYPLAAVVWTLILGPVGYRIALYVQTGSVASSSPYNEVLGILELFYLLYIVRYLRLKVVAAEASIAPILPGPGGSYFAFFRGFNRFLPVVLIGVAIEVPVFFAANETLGPGALPVYGLITAVIIPLLIASFIWEYSVASWGLHRIGRSKLTLRPYLEDRFRGTAAVGNLALSLTLAYYVGLVILFFQTSTFLPVYTNPGVQGFFVLLFALGIVLFFLPLIGLHIQMQGEKVRDQRELDRRYVEIRKRLGPLRESPPGSVENVEGAVNTLVQLKDLEMAHSRLGATPTWPFDLQLLARLAVIILSVIAAILARILTDLFHL